MPTIIVEIRKKTRVVRPALAIGLGGLLLAALWLGLVAMAPAHADPGIRYVATDGDDSKLCDSIADRCRTVQRAIDVADPIDEIQVATGTYTDVAGTVAEINRTVTLLGGWDGGFTTRDPILYPTTLDAQRNGRVVYISGNISPTIDGFIVTGGNASDEPINAGRGGGIYSEDASPIIQNNVIISNVASISPTVGSGGGIYLYGASASVLISDNLIISNTANTIAQGKGGGLILIASAATVSGNTFQGNVAGATSNSMGGGLATLGTPAVVSGNLIQGNKATPAGTGFGGGFYTQFGAVTLSGNIIISNAAQYGALTFEQNASITLTNNVVAQNVGGGVFVRGNATYPLAGTLLHNTITQNGNEGVYVGFYSSGYSTLALTNNIIVSHMTGIYAYQDINNSNVVTATHTLFYGNSTDTSGSTITSTNEITGSDPLFVDPAGWDYHIRADSPAVDAGTAVPWLTTDIDGDPRPWPAGGDYDIGADEYHRYTICLPIVMKGYAG